MTTHTVFLCRVGWAAALLAGCCLVPQARAADKTAPAADTATWDRAAAARYLDSREVWWQSWDRAHKDHGTYCISCHTQAPFALARPALHRDLADAQPAAEQAMIASIQKRVHQWNEMLPFYSDAISGKGKEVESRNAESVLNAVILTSYDAPTGHLSDTTRLAFDHAWALQSATGPDAGSWVWQNFDYAPWESKESQYYWAAQLALTVATAPDHYRKDRAATQHLVLLEDFLRSHYDAQPLWNKIVTLRASARIHGLLAKQQRKALLAQLATLQRDDGGWSLANFVGDWKRRDKTPLETKPDGFATGIVTLALEENGIHNAHVARGRAWLEAHQDKTTGAWQAWSVNKNRDPESNVGKFMSDAATGYAVLALDARR